MYLESLRIRNFRCIEDLTIEFIEGLNVIIGENNTGKTSIIDALRLAFSIGVQGREIFLSSDDFFINKFGEKANEIEFHLTFSDISEERKGVFYEMLSISKDEKEDENKDEIVNEDAKLKLHLRYMLENKNGVERIKFKYWGGEHEGENIPSELMDLFYFVYLGALRDAEKDLKPNRGNRLGQLFMKLERDQNKQNNYVKSIDEKIKKDNKWRDLIDSAKEKVNTHLENISMLSDTQSVEIDFLPLEFKKIVENLKMFIPFQTKIKREEIITSFGEENHKWKKYFENPDGKELIFKNNFNTNLESDTEINDNIKKILEDIYNKALKHFEINQIGLGYNNLIYIATVLGDLLERKEIEEESYNALLIEEPEAHLHPQLQDILFNYFKVVGKKQIQVFITSHSPTITAKTNIDSTIVLYKEKNKISNLPLRKCPLAEEHKKYLERFLDVTKSQLFFAKSVILVEGISEALLLPIFANIMGEKYDLDKNGVEVVNIGGVAFKPFAKLFNSEDCKKRLNLNCSIITDDDRDIKGEESSRAKKAKDLENGQLKVFLAKYTFEYELYIAENENTMIDVYRNFHQNFSIDRAIIIEKQAKQFLNKLKDNNDKAIFAQELSRRLIEDKDLGENFKVPQYIQDAIRWVTLKNE